MISLNKENLNELSEKIEKIMLPEETKDTSLANKIYHILLYLLIDGTIPPGTFLNRRELAEELGVSVAPVLEALIQLEIEGYITTIPRKGTIVNSYTVNDIISNLLLREAFECEAARFYCGKPVLEHIDDLMPLAAKADSAALDMEHQIWEDELLFHRALIALADIPSLLRQFSSSCQLNAFYSAFTKRTNGSTFDMHQKLLVNLSSSTPDQAEALIRYHIRTTINAVLQTHNTSSLSHTLEDFDMTNAE